MRSGVTTVLGAVLSFTNLIWVGFSAQCNTFTTENTCNNVAGCFWTDDRCACASTVAMDVIYAMDSSGSIGSSDFDVEKDWVVQMLDSTLPQDARTAFIRFASKVDNMLTLEESEPMSTQERQDFVENEIGYTAGATDTTGALDNSIAMFDAQSNDQISKLLILITDGNPNAPDGDNNVCAREQALKSRDITVVIIGVGDGWDPARVDCLVTDDQYIIEADDYSQDSLDALMPALTDVTCPVEYDFIVTEVQLETQADGSGSRFVEIYNKGERVTLRDVKLGGIFEGRISDDDSQHLNQSQYLVLYDDAEDDPSCQDCECDLKSGSFRCEAAQYIPCCSSGCDCWFAGTGMTNEDWEMRFIDDTNDNDIDYIIYDDSTWPTIFQGYTYTLKYTGYDNQKGDNWRQSCNSRGTPGSDPILDCDWTCTDDQCQQNGDSGADCDDNECDCSTDDNYYFSDRTCKLVPPPSDCYAYWLYNDSNGQEVVKYVWEKPQTDAAVNYTLTYPTTKGGNDKVQTQWRTKTVADFGKYDDYDAVAGYVQTNIDGILSKRTDCTSVSRAPTMRPSKYPTLSPSPNPTAIPTQKPTFDSPRLWVSGDLCEFDRCECYDREWECEGEDIYKDYAASEEPQFISIKKWPRDYPYFMKIDWYIDLLSDQYDPVEESEGSDGDNTDENANDGTTDARRRLQSLMENAFQSGKKIMNNDGVSLIDPSDEDSQKLLHQFKKNKNKNRRVLLSDDLNSAEETTTTLSPDEFGISPQRGAVIFNSSESEVEKISITIQKKRVDSADERYKLYELILDDCVNENMDCNLVYPQSFYMVVDITGGETLTQNKKEKEMPTWLWYLIAALVVFLAILAWLVYKYWWKNRQTSAQLVETEEELDRAFEENELGFGRDLGAGDIKFNPIATGAPGAVKAPQMGDQFIQDQKDGAHLDRADIAVEKFKVKNEMGQGQASRRPNQGGGGNDLSAPLLG